MKENKEKGVVDVMTSTKPKKPKKENENPKLKNKMDIGDAVTITNIGESFSYPGTIDFCWQSDNKGYPNINVQIDNVFFDKSDFKVGTIIIIENDEKGGTSYTGEVLKCLSDETKGEFVRCLLINRFN